MTSRSFVQDGLSPEQALRLALSHMATAAGVPHHAIAAALDLSPSQFSRTYYAAQHVQRDVDTGDRRLGYTVRFAIAEVRLLEGELWDLIETWRAATTAYQSAVEQWYKDREAAGREAIRHWGLAHPFPAAPTIEAEVPSNGSPATLEASIL